MNIHLLVVIIFALSVLTVLVYKVYQFLVKFNKVYKYFFTEEGKKLQKKDKKLLLARDTAPINGGCPETSELEKL